MFIDVKDLLSKYSLEQLNKTADEYFSTQFDNPYFLNKPFASIDETPILLSHLAAALIMLEVFHGCQVLDFGAGAGWTSRMLAQTGCKVISCDVSPAVLNISKRAHLRAGDSIPNSSIEYLEFDGYELQIPDGSIDRILCMDAFHHVVNQEQLMREFVRVLVPGGLLVFSEPGPAHSATPQSQSEMRTFAVVEQDFNVDELNTIALKVGFVKGDAALYSPVPTVVPISSVEEILATDLSLMGASTRAFHINHRLVRFHKSGNRTEDSRRRDGLSASIEVVSESNLEIKLRISNVGRLRWLPSGDLVGSVNLGCHLLTENHEMLDFEFKRFPISTTPVEPGGSVAISIPFEALQHDGGHIQFDLVAEQVAWLSWDGFSGPVISAK
jgi:2-polyprenyl-3-methyl-5-hydroxy-6-metoxy-1,4-benzoquinol methylase